MSHLIFPSINKQLILYTIRDQSSGGWKKRKSKQWFSVSEEWEKGKFV